MPTSKDLKRLIRERMTKTGESYTTARQQLLRKKSKSTSASSPDPARYAEIAGVKEETLEARTGCGWEMWVLALDTSKAHEKSHRDIARWISEKYDVSGWWAQTITVGYERIRGLREVGQSCEGTFAANKSKTFPVGISELYAAFSTKRIRERWLPVELKIRTSTREKSMRISWDDGTAVDAYFTDKGPQKSAVAIQHRKLASKKALEERKAYWGERLRDLHGELSG